MSLTLLKIHKLNMQFDYVFFVVSCLIGKHTSSQFYWKVFDRIKWCFASRFFILMLFTRHTCTLYNSHSNQQVFIIEGSMIPSIIPSRCLLVISVDGLLSNWCKTFYSYLIFHSNLSLCIPISKALKPVSSFMRFFYDKSTTFYISVLHLETQLALTLFVRT